MANSSSSSTSGENNNDNDVDDTKEEIIAASLFLQVWRISTHAYFVALLCYLL